MLHTENSSSAKSFIFLNMLISSNSGPFSPSFVKLPIADSYQVLAYRGISATQTIAFAQNLAKRHGEVIVVDWSLLKASVKSYNYGTAVVFIMTSA
jgi:hypothetical protein